MARIHALPSLDIIQGLKGILDFYLWKGLPCVRAWPTWRPTRQTEPSKAAALLFGAIIKAYTLLGDVPLEAYREDALDQTRTARDIMVTGVYGNLHEASMSDFLDLLTDCRDFLSNLQGVLNALDSLSLDELDVNVEASVLPSGAATAAAQATQLTALHKLDDLQDALQSKTLDRLLVRGMDQLHSYKEPLASLRTAKISGADGHTDSHTPAAGLIWHITHIATRDLTNATTAHRVTPIIGANWGYVSHTIRAIPADEYVPIPVHVWLENGHFIRCAFIGGLVNDDCTITLIGEVFTKET